MFSALDGNGPVIAILGTACTGLSDFVQEINKTTRAAIKNNLILSIFTFLEQEDQGFAIEDSNLRYHP